MKKKPIYVKKFEGEHAKNKKYRKVRDLTMIIILSSKS